MIFKKLSFFQCTEYILHLKWVTFQLFISKEKSRLSYNWVKRGIPGFSRRLIG